MNTSRASCGFDRPVVHAPPRHQREPVQRHALVRRHHGAVLLPVRVEVVALHEIAGDGLHPFGLYARGAARVEPRRLHQLRREHPARLLLAQPGAREDRELDAARAEILAGFLALGADVAEQPRDERAVHLLVGRGLLVDAHVHLARQRRELPVHVAPFPQPALREELLAQLLRQLAVRFPVFDRLLEVLPQLESDRKSERSSWKRACARSAASARSKGRSRGSSTSSTAAMTSTSARQFSRSAASIIRATRGSMGKRASRRPIGVSSFASSTAPSSASSW